MLYNFFVYNLTLSQCKKVAKTRIAYLIFLQLEALNVQIGTVILLCGSSFVFKPDFIVLSPIILLINFLFYLI